MQTDTSRKLSRYLYTVVEYGSYNSVVVDLREIVYIESFVPLKGNKFFMTILFKNKEIGEIEFKSLENLQEEFKSIRAAWEEMLSES